MNNNNYKNIFPINEDSSKAEKKFDLDKSSNFEHKPIKAIDEFWRLDDEGKVFINTYKFINYLSYLGFRKVYQNAKVIFVFIKNNVAQEIIIPKIKDTLFDNINNLSNYSERQKSKIINALLEYIGKFFNEKLLEALPILELHFNLDNKYDAYLYFNNVIVKIRKECGIVIIPYSELNWTIWKDQIIEKNFQNIEIKNDKSEFEKFVWNISNKDITRFRTICSAIGYLLHKYKNRSQAKAIIWMDEKLAGESEPHGRTGKSIIGRALGYIRNTIRIDGRNFEFNDRFTFQQINHQTEIIDFNDVQNNFPIDRLFSVITDDINIEPKGVNKYSIPFEFSPKFTLSTNYSLQGTGPSFRDRMFEIELSDHYNEFHKPIDEFGHHLFDDWDEQEWNRFYNFMAECISLYLDNGLISYERINVLQKKLIAETSKEFLSFIENNLELNKEYNKKDFYESFLNSQIESENKISQIKFTSYIKKYASYKRLKYKDRRSNGNDYFIIEKE